MLNDFRQVFLQEAHYKHSDQEMLHQAGALIRVKSEYAFTNAGFMFFAANPQRLLSWAFLRLLRFEANSDQEDERGLSTFEKKFTGPLIKQIRAVRVFFKETGFFKVYPRRNPEGGFIDEPEYPFIAVDEAIVNAVAHRDYAMSIPVECMSYKDALLVRNAGRVQQRDHDLPEQFSLDNTKLDSSPRNPKLIEWLKLMKDEQGLAFVRALREGTERMRREMASLSLPAPVYRISNAQTTVTLFNRATEREAVFHSQYGEQPTEFANLYPLILENAGSTLDAGTRPDDVQRELTRSLKDSLEAKGWYIDGFKFGRITAHRRGRSITLPAGVDGVVRFYHSYSFQIRHYLGRNYLCIDYGLEVKSVQNLQALLKHLYVSDVIGKVATVNWKGWQSGKILAADEEWTRVYLFDYKQEVRIDSDKVIPRLPKSSIELLLSKQRVKFDFNQAIKQHSLAAERNAARTRFEKTQAVADELAQTIFPLVFSGLRTILRTTPTPLLHYSDNPKALKVNSLREPSVEFGNNQANADIREGITKYGSYGSKEKVIEIVPLCTPELRDGMAALIERLKAGKYKYRGSERTFHTRFTYNSVITTSSLNTTLSECERLLKEHREWIGDEQLSRLFLIHVPEHGYALDDESSPYYSIKRFLLERGVPCQMVDTPTIRDPDWKDLNLALNIVAKCGVTPWVLPDAIPDADFFIGLSYTKNVRRGPERLMGYANVFSKFGKWVFYSGNTNTFSYEERTKYFQTLVRQTLERLTLTETPNIYFHYSEKFSRDDRAAILEAARSVRPQGTYSFVWINTHHNVRLYDSRVETDGSLSRGSFVITSPNQLYLSTTGYNPYRKALGTPQMLELNVWVDRPEGFSPAPPDLRSIAVQILSLTKLNWASTDSLCGEPITTKYAGDIAYLTSAFLRQESTFRLHEVLEQTPWFI